MASSILSGRAHNRGRRKIENTVVTDSPAFILLSFDELGDHEQEGQRSRTAIVVAHQVLDDVMN